MADLFKMCVPGKPEYVGTVRMAVAHIAAGIGFDIEAIDDIKVAVSEACTNIIRHSHNHTGFSYDITVEREEKGLVITVKDGGVGFETEDYTEPVPGETRGSGMGIFIVRALMDEVDIQSEVGVGTNIRMKKYLQSRIA